MGYMGYTQELRVENLESSRSFRKMHLIEGNMLGSWIREVRMIGMERCTL